MRTGQNIYKRKDGRWEARYKPPGGLKYQYVYGKTYTEAKAKRDALKKAPVKRSSKNITFGELFSLYSNSIKYSVKESTLSNYHSIYKCQLSEWKNEIVNKITQNNFNDFIYLKLSLYSPKYVSDMMILLFAILQYAKTENYTKNEFKIIKIKEEISVIQVFSDDEQKQLEDHLMDHKNLTSIGILLCLQTGLRIGELCALKISDFDFKNNTLFITRTLQRIKNTELNANMKTKIIIDTPKSKAGTRLIPIPETLSKVIQGLVKQNYKGAFFLTGSIERFIGPRTIQNRYKTILETCKIKYRKFHVLRHTFATNGLQKKFFDIKTLSEMLGHSDIQVTLRKYYHVSIEMKTKSIEKQDKDFISRQNHSQKKSEKQMKQAIA